MGDPKTCLLVWVMPETQLLILRFGRSIHLVIILKCRPSQVVNELKFSDAFAVYLALEDSTWQDNVSNDERFR
jgi:hypothetical protein